MFNFQPGCLVRFRPGLLARTKARYRCFPPPSCCSFTPRHLASTLVMQPQPHPEWERIRPSNSSVPPFYAFAREIKRSEQDDRQYRIIQLDNGLQVTLVHDSKADKAAASLDVAVGHLNDPDDMPGLAHFCEHLLFMGTERFPRENEYSEYLAKNNGASNAYTSTSNTNYYFSVSTHALSGALERFASFFHSPLFDSSCTSRELNAVDSEHRKNHQADLWRIFQVNKHLSKPGHAWSKFGSGNRDSLTKAARVLKLNQRPLREDPVNKSPIPSRGPSPAPSTSSNNSESDADGGFVGRETRRRLLEWWSKEYCASRMRLCIIGKESLDELSELASSLFSPVLNRGRDPLPMIEDHPFGENEKGTLVSVQTVMAFHAMEISFPLEYQPPFWRQKPIDFISHFVGHEGPGSLHSHLKNKHWVSSLSTGQQNLARGFAMFKITIHLTSEGFKNYRSVILAAHKYLALLRSSVFEPFHQREQATIFSTHFRFIEKKRPDNYATWITEHMAWPVPRELLLAGPQLILDEGSQQGTGEHKVREYLESFRVRESRVVLMAKAEEHAKVQPECRWEREPWYSTEYSVQKFDEAFITEAESPKSLPEFFLPGPNEFLPTNLDVEKREVSEPLKRPHLIRETPLSALWHKKDDKFWAPKANVIIDIRSPLGNASARASVLTRLYSDIVKDSLTEFAYDADLAGLSYSFSPHSMGLYVSMNGYNDKMSVLVRHVLEKVKGLVVDPQRLAVIKDQAQRDWQNFFMGHSYSISDYYGRYLMAAQQWTIEEKLAELPSVTAEEIQRHMKDLLSQVKLRILVVGNMFKDEAIRIAEMAEEGLGVSPTADLNEKALIMPARSNFVWSSPLPNPNQANSALTYYLHFGSVVNQRLRVVSSLLTQILTEPTFNVLRTKEQLGYIVLCSNWSLPGASEKGLRIVVQSEKPPPYLEKRVEAFLDSMRFKIEDMSIEEFQGQKEGLEKKWMEADKNLYDEAGRYMLQINSGHWDFLRNEDDARLLKSITKEEMLEIFMSHVHPSSVTRSKLSVHLVSQKPRPKKISMAAAQGFEALLRTIIPEIDIDNNISTADIEDRPTVFDFVDYWKERLKPIEAGDTLLAALSDLVEKYPVDAELEGSGGLGGTSIQDIKAFKAGLTISVDPGPMVQWGDLPVPRF